MAYGVLGMSEHTDSTSIDAREACERFEIL